MSAPPAPDVQNERRLFLLTELIKEKNLQHTIQIPTSAQEQKYLLRSLFNIRMPKPVSKQFLETQDAYLKEAIARNGITDFSSLKEVLPGIYLWKGDISTLRCDAIVNAANSQMLGCFAPCHTCIDNCIHTYSGIQLREACAAIMNKQKHEEPTGQAKITPAFNLPCKYVLHTVGPIIEDLPTAEDKRLLASCYQSCLDLCLQNNITSVAFCCISTGEFHYPKEEAADIAIETVKNFLSRSGSQLKVIFNVFSDDNFEIYSERLKK